MRLREENHVLRNENNAWRNENSGLRTDNHRYMNENSALKQRLLQFSEDKLQHDLHKEEEKASGLPAPEMEEKVVVEPEVMYFFLF